jgi:hypothetical protein
VLGIVCAKVRVDGHSADGVAVEVMGFGHRDLGL